jgi:hypothetical protein
MTKNILTTYTPTITILPGRDKTEYLKLAKLQLTPKMFELLIDITVEYDTEIRDSLKNSERLEEYNKLCAVLDGDLVC